MPEEFTINPWGLTGLFAVLMAWSLAVFLLRSADRDRLTVLFAMVLLVEGAVLITAGSGLVTLLNLQVAQTYYIPHHIADCVLLFVYPLFLAHALPQRALRFLRHRTAVVVMAIIATAVCIIDFVIEFWLIAAALAVMFWIAFGFAVHAVFVARTKLARQRALLFVIAFGLRDLCWSLVYSTGVFGFWRDTDIGVLVLGQIYAGSTLLYVPIVAYGILSVRLLDIKIEIRKGVKRGTLAAVFVALFFLISEGAASMLSDRFGTVAGLLGATLIVFLVSPLHRLSEWFSGQVVPTEEDSEYRAYRKLQMYAVAVEDALAYGDIGPARRSLLNRLRESLEVSPDDARRIEADLGI